MSFITHSNCGSQFFHQQNGAFEVSLSEPGNFSRLISRNVTVRRWVTLRLPLSRPSSQPQGVWLVIIQYNTGPTPWIQKWFPETATNAPSQSDHATNLLPLPYSCVWALVRTTYERNEEKVQGLVRVKCCRSWFYCHIESGPMNIKYDYVSSFHSAPLLSTTSS